MNIPQPPKTKKELFQRIADVIRHGEYDMPITRYKGTGGPGIFLEDLLGLTTGNKDIPDSIGWELKYYTVKTNLITLFHKEPQPIGIMRYMVSKFGWKDSRGRLSFRHTISGKSDRFIIEEDAGQIVVRPIKGNGSIPYWTQDDILSVAGGKLRRLALVRGSRKLQKVKFEQVDCFENLQLTEFIYDLTRGIIKIDFDVREAKAGSIGLRNHGTKFRVSPYDVCHLYSKKERIC
jgi:hypothetical protein